MQYVSRTTSGTVRGERTLFFGLNASSAAGATINIKDGGSGGTTVLQFIIPASTSIVEDFDELPFNTDVYLEVASGTLTHGVFFVE